MMPKKRFDLEVNSTNRTSYKCTDFLRFYLDLERLGINEKYMWNYEFCGDIKDMQQKTFYSRHRIIVLEFGSRENTDKCRGFRGKFTFKEKKLYAPDGVKDKNSCRYVFQSTDLYQSKNGQFFSPRYPQNYPAKSNCQYIFYGLQDEVIQLLFRNIQLESFIGRCSSSPDFILVRDGENSFAPLIAEYCNLLNHVDLTSSGPYMYVEFIADGQNQQQGFVATFNFINKNQIGSADRNRFPTAPGPVTSMNECKIDIISTKSKSGVIKSMNYPQTYPKTSCVYNFYGRGRERVQIIFEDFELYFDHPDKYDPKDCNGVDSLRVTVYINGSASEMNPYCGSKLPPALMSSNHQMTLRFVSVENPVGVRGFKARYKFVTNFGIQTGLQDSDKVCGFIYKSKQQMTGEFWSPNYPGIYPRVTECHYLFYGQKNERVKVTLKEFKVEGLKHDCSDTTHSDYLELSEMEPNSKPTRYCGSHLNFDPITSKDEFFRVTFKSNEKFDEQGFLASYTFISSDDVNPTSLNVGLLPPTNRSQEVAPYDAKIPDKDELDPSSGSRKTRNQSEQIKSRFVIWFSLYIIACMLSS
ncbi:suppressor of lurcher protein 1-like isoform X2 [Tubulanus polymorphus]|uniref:suppressor of lurcher protein 1-like isoform X2 n=1 Tax=Tubulanus polymorphus TaxID=672921 RepID=UPI003DA684CA